MLIWAAKPSSNRSAGVIWEIGGGLENFVTRRVSRAEHARLVTSVSSTSLWALGTDVILGWSM
jgi:hypothetical protein